MSVSGSDQTAPALNGTWPENITEQDNCFDDADTTSLKDASEIAALYNDCSNVTVTVSDEATTNDNCGWTWTRTYTIKDECGNTVTPAPTMSVSGSDQTVPELTGTWPEDITEQSNCFDDADISELYSNDQVKALYSDCSNITVTSSDEADPTDNCGWTITRTYTIADECGNTVTPAPTMSVSGSDKTAPTFTAPADTTIFKDENCEHDASPEITGTISNVLDNCSTTFDTNYVDQDVTERYATCEGHMVIERTWTVTDECGNVSLPQTQIIAVRDSIKPTFTAPKDTTIYKDENCEYDITVANVGDVTDEADNCTSVLEASFSDSIVTPDDACKGMLVIQRTWSLVDDCGNMADDQIQTITVSDTTKPTFTAPADITLCRDENGEIAADTTVAGIVTDAADNCSTELTIEWNDTDTTGTDAEDRVITRTWSVSDACGNVATAEQLITVRPSVLTEGNFDLVCKDTTIVLPYNTDSKKLALNAPDTANHMIGMAVVLTNNYPADSVFTVGTTTITWTATDECGHSISCSFNVNVEYPPCDSASIDGHTYPALRIGSQCWLGENLRNSKYADGGDVANWKHYNDDASNEETFGKLYSWYSAVRVAEGDDSAEPEKTTVPQNRNRGRGKFFMAPPTQSTPGSQFVQGLCPEGWAVPTSGDFMILLETAGTTDKVKDSRIGWLPGYEGTEPNTGFNARGAGYYDNAIDRFLNLLGETYFWTSDPAANSNDGTCIVINYHCADGLVQEQDKGRCHSVRCLKVY